MKDPGIIPCKALSQLDYTNNSVLIKLSQNRDVFERHESAEHTMAFRANRNLRFGMNARLAIWLTPVAGENPLRMQRRVNEDRRFGMSGLDRLPYRTIESKP